MSRKPPPIAESQCQALELARRQGGNLYRTEAGWGPEKFDPATTPFADLFSHGTVRALVTRRAMEWCATNGTRWVQARIVP